MIIFGTRGVTYNYERGQFFCPSCGPDSDYAHKRVRRFFTLYFIPMIPLDLLGEYVECGTCMSTYKQEVLALDPGADNEAFEAEFHTAIRHVMVKMMLADGVIDDEELASICEIYERLSGTAIGVDRIRAEAAALEGDEQSISSFVEGVRPSLNDNGKELVVKAALAIAAADGTISDDEKLLLLQIGEALEMTEAHLMGVMATAAEA